ncbi:MAG: RnfABCDGE type electron transport complex subunit G [Butyrivibrio sp.]|nr:RnfABCDGE type electron transport complex subunit G [Butyrivibrio sp.]
MKKIIKDALVLFAITLISGLLLGVVYKVTKKPIEEQNEKTKIAAYNNVFDKLETYEEITALEAAQDAIKEAGYTAVTLNEAVRAFDASGKELGMIITVTDADGYGGNIKMTLGVDVSGTITGLEILDISETAGLGMKAKDAAFREQFAGIKAERVEYTKSGKTKDNEIDAISSATITTKAVTAGVNGALEAYRILGDSPSAKGGDVSE